VISAEFIVNTGQYQHVKLTVQGDDVECFSRELDALDDALKVKLGIFQAETESWVRGTYEEVTSKGLEAAQKLLQDALGATVVESIPKPSAPPQTASEPAWKTKPGTTKPEPWKAPATTNNGDDW